MKLKFLLLLSAMCYCNVNYSQLNLEFAKSPTDIHSPGGSAFGMEIRLDAAGNSVVTGRFYGTHDFDPGPGIYNLYPTGGNAFIAKYSPAGNLVFAKQFGENGTIYAQSLTIDNSGNFVVLGYFHGTLDFDPGPGVANLSSLSPLKEEIFIAKFDTLGNYMYAKHMVGDGNYNTGSSIASDALDNIYITGRYSDTVDFDPGTGTSFLYCSFNANMFVGKYDPSGNLIYINDLPGPGFENGECIYADAAGNVTVTGYFQNTIDFDPSPAVANLTSSGSNDIFFARYDGAGNYLLAKSMGGPNDDYGNAITIDPLGNILVAGDFKTTVDFDPGPGVSNLISAGAEDLFFAKYDPAGNLIYARRAGSTDRDRADAIDVDATGNTYITGPFRGTVDFDPGPSSAFLQTGLPSIMGLYVAKYDVAGNFTFATAITCDSTASLSGLAYSESIAVDNPGNAYITGSIIRPADFDPGASAAILIPASNQNNVFVAKYNPTGNYNWASLVEGYSSGTNLGYGSEILRDTSGNIFITGGFSGNVDFDPSAGVLIRRAAGARDAFLAKYDSSGNVGFAKSFGGLSGDGVNSMAIDNAGNIYLSGGFAYLTDFDPSAAIAALDGMSGSGFFAKYDNNGNFIYAKRIGAEPTLLSLDAAGNIYLSGSFMNTVDMDPSALTFALNSAGNDDIFFAKYDNNGNFVYAKRMGAANPDEPLSMEVDPSGNVFLSGYFWNTVDFDPNAGTVTLTSAGNKDIFFAKYDALGNYVFAKSLGASNPDEATSIKLDVAGNIILGGHFYNTMDFDPGAGTANLTATGSYDLFFARYDALGNYINAKNISGPGSGVIYLNTDQEGNIYASGPLDYTNDFDPGAGVHNLSAVGGQDIFIAKYDSLCQFIYAKNIGGSLVDYLHDFVVEPSGKIYMTGHFLGTSDFDPNPGVTNLTALSGAQGIFFAKFNEGSTEVWPGDADNTNIVDNSDLLQIGLFHSATGSARSSVSNAWQDYMCVDWGTLESNGSDIKHADCNGDGAIDDNDTLAINQNFSLAHAFIPDATAMRLVNPDLSFSTASSGYIPGAWVDVDIHAGNSTLPVTDLYGIAYNINYNSSLVVPGSESLSFPNSWFANPGVNAVKIGKINAAANTAHAGETRTDHLSSDGFGKIGTLHFQIKPSITSMTTMNLNFSGYAANDSAGNALYFNPGTYSFNIYPIITDLTTNDETVISVFPNPNNGTFYVSATDCKPETEIAIYSVHGKMICKKEIIRGMNSIDITENAAGIYFYKVVCKDEMQMSGKVIVK